MGKRDYNIVVTEELYNRLSEQDKENLKADCDEFVSNYEKQCRKYDRKSTKQAKQQGKLIGSFLGAWLGLK